MKDIPIIFSAPMVRALLDGRKTMTRRLAERPTNTALIHETDAPLVLTVPSPWQRVKPGDRLWVREAFMPRPMLEEIAKPHYRADPGSDRPEWRGLYKPSIHMPRRLSRITLIVTAVKVERLHDITRDDAIAEGLIKLPATGRYVVAKGDQYFGGADFDPRVVFTWLWAELHGVDSCDANPDVVAITFKVHKQNIDTLPKAVAA